MCVLGGGEGSPACVSSGGRCQIRAVHVEGFDLNACQVHVTQQTVDDLQQRLLHAG